MGQRPHTGAVHRQPVLTLSGKVMRRLAKARELRLPEGDVPTLEQTS
ncbi:hypothetical protein [Actinomadura miaoliensis]